MVGISTALHLQQRGRSVVLIDRRGAGEETSYGNTGIIQREGVVPYPFPRDIRLMAQYALNLRPEANLHWSALPKIAPWLYHYWRASTPERLAATSRAARPLVERCISRARGADGRRRHPRHDPAHRLSALPPLGRGAGRGDRQGRRRAQDLWRQLPARRRRASWPSSSRICGAPGRRRADARSRQRGRPRRRRARPMPRLFEERGGRFVQGDARTLAPDAQRLAGADAPKGRSRRDAVVVALGPWSDDVLPPARLCACRSASSAAITCTSSRRATPRSTGRSSTSRTAMRSRRW